MRKTFRSSIVVTLAAAAFVIGAVAYMRATTGTAGEQGASIDVQKLTVEKGKDLPVQSIDNPI